MTAAMTMETRLTSLVAVADYFGSGEVAIVGPLADGQVTVATSCGSAVRVDSVNVDNAADRVELIALLRKRFALVHVAETEYQAAWLCSQQWPCNSLVTEKTTMH
jgi:hypothetical protein